MTEEELAAIEARAGLPGRPAPIGYLLSHWAEMAADDRAALLAEVRRLQALVGTVIHDRMQEPGPMGDALALAAEKGRLEILGLLRDEMKPLKCIRGWVLNRSPAPALFDCLKAGHLARSLSDPTIRWRAYDTREAALADLEQAMARLARRGLAGSA